MATSSIHKPGWRSRRRSRLSLVERAVPRLGRSVEKGEKTARGGETLSPSSSKSSNISKVETAPALHGETGLSLDSSKPDHDHDHAPEATPPAQAPTLERIPKYAAAQVSDVDRTSPATEDEASALHPSSEQPAFAAIRTETSSPMADVLPSTEAQDDAGIEPTDRADMPPPLAEAATVSASLSARIEADRADAAAARSDEPAQAAGPKLELNWDQLVDSGFTDPRDRSRPLSKNMDEIVRALIRQALSDQASWRDRVILVTSPYDRAGKTTAAINFAFGLTTVAGHHAVLVDVDTIGPGAVDRLGGGEFRGITAALVDQTIELDEVVIKTNLDRLTLVASGAADEETLDRFASRRMLQILRYLTENPDTILIIDAPPILLSQEAAVLSVIAGQVVLAVEAGTTTADQIEHALQRIGDRHNVSLVLNACSGTIGKDTPKAARRTEPQAAKRRTPEVKRRLPRAAAAAVAFAFCLLMLPAVGQASLSIWAVSTPHVPMSSGSVLPPERCSPETEVSLIPCQRMCR